MAGTVEQKVFRALVERFQAWPLPTGWTEAANVAYPGLHFTPVAGKPFVSVEVHYNRSVETDISMEMDPIRQGFMRLNVMWPNGQGHVAAIEVAGSIRAHFRRGSKATKEDTVVRIYEDPEIGVILTGDTHINVPVTVRWRAYP
ncbi:uncharacterized protein DUF4128 [Rhizobium subbaraonis]|uniref:Uncharacterized protein DUF4128 n=1 Tax=Rhizobium subbaraonis TaxID=908946 RepID=A0A285UV30_9HYPH|nr:phage tail terminator-like protein [Rhizobium subbaraonis]SOC45765.1 uncharacterized protein DUF4128 [Rhizobium subbaraonis]